MSADPREVSSPRLKAGASTSQIGDRSRPSHRQRHAANHDARLRKRARHISSIIVKQALSLILVIDPGRHLSSSSFLSLACRIATPAAITMLSPTLFITLHPAIAIDGIVAETSKHTVGISLQQGIPPL